MSKSPSSVPKENSSSERWKNSTVDLESIHIPYKSFLKRYDPNQHSFSKFNEELKNHTSDFRSFPESPSIQTPLFGRGKGKEKTQFNIEPDCPNVILILEFNRPIDVFCTPIFFKVVEEVCT